MALCLKKVRRKELERKRIVVSKIQLILRRFGFKKEEELARKKRVTETRYKKKYAHKTASRYKILS
jgi:hypothetical protein